MQVPVVAQNITEVMAGNKPTCGYDGYGSCPLTVERGKIVLAEFGYGGKLLPTFPDWVLKGTEPTRAAWILKARILPDVYWHGMLKGHEWMVAPKSLESVTG
jgi:sulfide:quinone oxidoreductase